MVKVKDGFRKILFGYNAVCLYYMYAYMSIDVKTHTHTHTFFWTVMQNYFLLWHIPKKGMESTDDPLSILRYKEQARRGHGLLPALLTKGLAGKLPSPGHLLLTLTPLPSR